METVTKRREVIEIDDDSSDDSLDLIRRDDDTRQVRPRHLSARNRRSVSFGLGSNGAARLALPDPGNDYNLRAEGQLRPLQGLSAGQASAFGEKAAETIPGHLLDPLLDFDFDGDLINPALLNMEDSPGLPHRPNMEVPSSSGFDGCLEKILELFPDISHQYCREIYDAQLPNPVQGQLIAPTLITQILDKGKYPKEKDRQRELKRKRLISSDDEEIAYLKNLERGEVTSEYAHMSKLILQEDFPHIPRRYIDQKFKEKNQYFATYQALELASLASESSTNPPFEKLKRLRSLTLPQGEDFAWMEDLTSGGYGIQELKREILAARKVRRKEEANQKTKMEVSAAAAAKEKEYRDRGEIMDCGTCCDDYPTYNFVHCDGDCPHFLCFGCLQRYTDTEIGNQRYKLNCLDDSGCTATYSRKERQRALDPKSFDTLERLQQQAELKLANMAGLENCPFCDFAAICPPVQTDREFRCRNPECEKISCRLCRKDSHIPMSCKEYKESLGVDERHAVEEAMTKALLKTCPKCSKQILKQDGCNKIICFCGGMLCDYCGKDITKEGYQHFEGPSQSKSKKCPTHDNFHERRKAEVNKAEAEAIKKAREENPNLTEEQLKLKFSKAVENDLPNRALPNLDGLPQHVREHVVNRLDLVHRLGLGPPGWAPDQVAPQIMPEALRFPNAPPYQPMPVDRNYLMPPYAYLPPLHPGLGVGGVPQNAFGDQPPAPDLRAGAQQGVRVMAQQGEIPPMPAIRAPARRPADPIAPGGNPVPDRHHGHGGRAREFDPFALEMPDAMHEGQRAYREDQRHPVDVTGGRVGGEGLRRRRERRTERP